jgi:TRAP-type transport system small permease protein
MFQFISHLIDRIVEGFGVLSGFMLCSMISMSFFESVARYLGYPTTWTLEFTEYALVYLVYLGMSYAEKYGSHIRVEFFINLLPKKIKNHVEIFNAFCIILFSVMMTYYGFRLLSRSFASGVVSPTPVRVPLFWIHAVLPIGMAVMAIKNVFTFLSLVRER